MSAKTGDPVKTNVPIFLWRPQQYNVIKTMPTDITILLVTSPAWPPVTRGRQGRAIVANQAST